MVTDIFATLIVFHAQNLGRHHTRGQILCLAQIPFSVVLINCCIGVAKFIKITYDHSILDRHPICCANYN
jgi:hypothetical protein